MKTLVITCALYLISPSLLPQCDTFVVDVDMSNPSCYGFADGCLTLSPSGGTPPYTIEMTDESGAIINVGGVPMHWVRHLWIRSRSIQ